MNKSTILSLLTAVSLGVTGCQSLSEDERPRAAAPTTAPASHPSGTISDPGRGAAGVVPTVQPTTQPTTTPAAGGELMSDASGMAGYGEERYRIVNQADEIVSVLKNGMVVITKRIASPVVSVRAYVYTGGVYEGRWLGGGLSHLLEHLVAGGSTEKRTEAENRDLLQKLGNNSNAYTTTDHTAYFVNTTADRMEPAVDLVAGWMLGAKITTPEYRREYQVVQRELEMGKGEPDRVFYYMGQTNRYKVSPARVPVIGYQEVIQGLSRDDVYEYYRLSYRPNNMVFSVTGDRSPEEMLRAVRQHVKDAPPGREFSRDIPDEPPVLSPRTMVGTFPKLGQAKLQLGFPTVRLSHPDLYALDLLATILGAGESSVLVEKLRDELQLVSNVSAVSDTPSYVSGTFEVDLELAPEKVAEATAAALEILESAKRDGAIPAERIERAKTQMKTARVRRLLTADEVGSSLATDYMMTGDPHFSDRYVERIAAVTPQQLVDVANRYFDRSKLLTTALVPAEWVGAGGLPKAEDLLRPVAPTTRQAEEQPASQVVKVDLGNGVTLLTKRITTSPLVVMNLYSLGGVTAEDAKTNGLGNLAMEMAPRGTRTRSAQQIAEFWDSIGGELETTCGNNTWAWSANCLKGDFEKAFEVFADVVNNPTFPEAELGPMKRRIAAQIESQDADWTAQAFRFFKKSYYGPQNSPYQFMAIGTKEGVGTFDVKQVQEWYGGRVLQGKKVLAVFGDIDPKQAEALARKHLAAAGEANLTKSGSGTLTFVDATTQAVEKVADDKAAVTVDRVEVNKTEQPLAGVVVGFRANTTIGEAATFPIAVADTMASGYTYPTGYLHEILRGRGLVYVVHATNSAGRPGIPGTFMVYAGCDPSKVNEVVDVIVENVARLQGTPADVNEDWFNRSKELAVVAEAMENETPAAQAQQAALDELYGLGYDWHQRFADNIRGVRLSDVRDTARARLNSCVVTVSTPSPEQVKVPTGRRSYDAFPPVDLTPRGVQHDAGGK